MMQKTLQQPEALSLSQEIIKTETDLLAAIHQAKKLNVKAEYFYYDEDLVELPQYDMTHDYYAEFWKTYLITHLQVSQLKQLSTAVSRIEEKIAEVQHLDSRLEDLMKQKNRKKNRRAAKDIPKNHPCPYKDCFRIYGGEVSLNLHIKNNHNGGTKTERQRLAKQYMRCRALGLSLPTTQLNLPPGFLQTIDQLEQNDHVSHGDASSLNPPSYSDREDQAI